MLFRLVDIYLHHIRWYQALGISKYQVSLSRGIKYQDKYQVQPAINLSYYPITLILLSLPLMAIRCIIHPPNLLVQPDHLSSTCYLLADLVAIDMYL